MGARKYIDVDMQALGNFAFNNSTGVTQDIPSRWRDLDGRRVSLKGFMFQPMDNGAGARQYQLVHDLHLSEHRGPPLVQERVLATAPAATPVYPPFDPAQIDGVLHVGVVRDASGAIRSVFRMDVESVTVPVGSLQPPVQSSIQLTKWMHC